MPIVVRDAAPEDANAIAANTRKVSAHEGLPPPRFDANTLLRFGLGEGRAFQCFVATHGAEIVGHISVTRGFDIQEAAEIFKIIDLFVDDRRRRTGAGRALLRHVARLAAEEGALFVQWRMAPANAEADVFYSAMGGKRDTGVHWVLGGEALRRLAEG